MSPDKGIIGKAWADPRAAIRVALAYVRGWFYRVYYPLTGRRFRAGPHLRVQGRLRIRGPGRVVFGSHVVVGDTTRFWTYTPEAVIEVGAGCFLNGAHIWCNERVTLGPRVIVGRAELIDTDFHSTHVERHRAEAPVRTRPVTIGENVWIGARAGILPGASVGKDAVVGYGAICAGALEGGKIYVGNPARSIGDVPRDPLPDTIRGGPG